MLEKINLIHKIVKDEMQDSPKKVKVLQEINDLMYDVKAAKEKKDRQDKYKNHLEEENVKLANKVETLKKVIGENQNGKF